jgi:uroporphyrinogen decarboxylase
MLHSKKLIEDVCRGIRPERTPIFDLLLNDAVIEHFAGRPLDGKADEETVILAAANGLDGTRWIPVPDADGRTWTDDMGNVRVASRWTCWVQRHALNTPEQWAAWLPQHIECLENEVPPSDSNRQEVFARQQSLNARLNGTVFIHCTPATAINEALFGPCGCGLEMFSYLWADDRDLVLRWLRALELQQRHVIERAAHAGTCNLAMIYSDVAFKGRTMFGRDMFRHIGFFEDVERICHECHLRGLKVIFHSDGYVMDIMSDLMVAGIDGLNPIEKAAGMDIYELRRQYPELILVGGVDVTYLLREGRPDDIRTQTRRILAEVGSEGHLLIGSSTELDNGVPLENYLAFHNEVTNGH